MLKTENFETNLRGLKTSRLGTDLAIVGGGMSGVCAAITAARQGVKVVLVQDRPVLGGNASSEVRLWILGATSHMGNNNRWAREGGVIDEILVENLYRNPEGNPLILDTILLEKIKLESKITLLLNTSVFDVYKSSENRIEKIIAFCSQNSTQYEISAPLFCDASGDGIVGFKAGASFRMGAESKSEFGELFAPEESYGGLLGHSMYFYSKRAGKPVKYIPPAFALKDIKKIPRYKIIDKNDSGCRFWWLEYGGRRDTVHDTEEIKWELWSVIYGVWDYIKNSGEFEDVDDLTLEWVGTIPGKRESRRFEGLYMLKQQDLVEQRHFEDAVSFGGWALDLHPADGVYSNLPGCTQWHTKGIYQVPYRCYVSKDIENLFFAGRIISATHVAFGSTRVMATSAFGAQAVGMAASLCSKENLLPAHLMQHGRIKNLQQLLNLSGQSIPGIPISNVFNKAAKAKIIASGSLVLSNLPADGTWFKLSIGVAQLLPLKKGIQYNFSFAVKSTEKTNLQIQLRTSSKTGNYTSDIILETIEKELVEGEQLVEVKFTSTLPEDDYAFVTFIQNEKVQLANSSHRFTGILSVFNGKNKAVSNDGKQTPPDGIGIDSFEFWIPFRRPEGKNLSFKIEPPIDCFGSENLVNGFVRPFRQPNAWIANDGDNTPKLTFKWEEIQKIKEVKIFLDNDFDHPMESVLMGHPENEIPFCVKNISIKNKNKVIAKVIDNHQTIVICSFEEQDVQQLIIDFEHPGIYTPAAIFEIQIN
jgi:hypothetical protein